MENDIRMYQQYMSALKNLSICAIIQNNYYIERVKYELSPYESVQESSQIKSKLRKDKGTTPPISI